MGMFAEITVHPNYIPAPRPEWLDGRERFQTKDVDVWSKFDVRADGTLWKLNKEWTEMHPCAWYTGAVHFYAMGPRGVADHWYEAILLVVKGRVIHVERASKEMESV